jgi:hypothetical protein
VSSRNRLVELKRELEWRKCVKDEAYFLENYWMIQSPASGRIVFTLRDAQREALVEWATQRYSLTLKARQIGWTTLVAAHQFWLAFFHDDQNIIDISRTEREAVLLLKKTKYGFRNLPKWILDRGPQSTVEHQQKMVFDNGSQITSMPSASDPARGESATLIVVDEWAFLPNPEEAWASIEPVADVGGRIIGLSTANGSGNFFHSMWVGAETRTNQFSPMFYPWSANADRDQAWYETKKRSMTSWQIAQEYPNNAEEAFIKSGRTVFDVDDLIEKIIPEEPVIGMLVERMGPKDFEWVANPNGERDFDPLHVWQTPQAHRAYVIGADVAEGLDWGDFSCAHVIDVESGLVVAEWHGHTPADVFGSELFRLGLWYNSALVGVESNNHGLTTITALRRLGYKRLFRRRRLNSTQANKPMMEFGWHTNKSTKPLMIDELGRAIRDQDIEIRSAGALGELRTYVRDERGAMGGSPHDDRVMSLAVANQMLNYAWAPEYKEKHDDYWTIDWFSGLQHDAEPRSDGWVIGAGNTRSRF